MKRRPVYNCRRIHEVETGIDSKKLIAFASEILEDVTGEESKEIVTV